MEQFPPTSTERQLSTRSLWFKSHVWRQLAKNESRDVEEQVLTSPTMRLCYWRPLAVFEFHSIRYIGYINEDPVHYIRIECWACWPKINLINRNLFVPGIRKEIVQENSFFTYDEFTENSQGNELWVKNWRDPRWTHSLRPMKDCMLPRTTERIAYKWPQ